MLWKIASSNQGTGLPLEGMRVLDLSRVLAGPLCAMIAGDLGADVIKVEGPGGDPVRSLAPPQIDGLATYFLAINRHRRNVVADLRDPKDFARVASLVREADAVIENFLPSQVRNLKIDELRAANSECVWVSITPATSGGVLEDLPSFDLLAQARSGLMGVTGTSGGPAMKVGAPVADVVTGLYGAVALLSGLFARANGSSARDFEVPLLESTMTALVNQAQGFLATSINPGRLGNEHPSIAPYGPVTTRDGVILLAVGTDQQYEQLVRILDDGELRSMPWSTNAERVDARDELGRALNGIFSKKSSAQWLAVLAPSGVPHAPVLDVAGAFAQEQISRGDFVGEMSSPVGTVLTMKTPLRINGVRPGLRSGPHGLGEDTATIFGDD